MDDVVVICKCYGLYKLTKSCGIYMCVGAYGHMGETGIQGTKHARQLLSNPGSSNRIIATDLITNIRRSILAAVGERLEIKKKALPTLSPYRMPRCCIQPCCFIPIMDICLQALKMMGPNSPRKE